LDASFASERPKVTVANLLRVPIMQSQELDDIDRITSDLFSLKDSNYALIDDIFNYTLPDFKGG
jgi:hypothetical protein